MIYLLLKAALSGLMVASASEAARRSPVFGALIVSLPLVSVLGMIWLWRDTHDSGRVADLATGAFWYVLPSMPMFLLIPALLRRGVGFWAALGAGCLLTIILYALMVAITARFGLKL
ncbi:MAG: peptide transporter permease [Caulobacteraceae bacterium]|jgi:F0F1-type ATP synthase assembly protein I|nr:peptide transporter permease [Caulobacteraceae bacterium]